MCGEQPSPRRKPLIFLGSPPRVRGTGVRSPLMSDNFRITPACAGNRAALASQADSIWDHPRVCGEQDAGRGGSGKDIGSPPRVRGTEICSLRRWSCIGITPACAGNSCTKLNKLTSKKDHPRVCGEQQSCDVLRHSYPGSPPRVRGTAIL